MKALVKFFFGVLILSPLVTKGQDNFNMRLLAQKIVARHESITDIEFYHDYGYMACGQYGLEVIDPSRPEAENCLNIVREGIPNSFTLDIHDNLLIAGGSNECAIFSLEDPVSPRLISQFDTIGNFIVNENAIHTMVGHSYRIYSIVDAFNPSLVFELNELGIASSVCAEGDLVCIALTRGRIVVFDVSDPTRPVRIDDIYADQTPNQMRLVSETLYCMTGNGKWRVFDLRDRENFEQIAQFDLTRDSEAFHLFGNRLAILARNGTVYLYDLSDARDLSLLETIDSPIEGLNGRINYSGSSLFVVSPADHNGLHIFDIVANDNLEYHGSYRGSGEMVDMKILRNKLYVGFSHSGVRVYDVSNLDQIMEIAHFLQDTTIESLNLDYSGNLLVTKRIPTQNDNVGYLGIYNIGDIENIHQLSELRIYANDMAIVGDTAYVAMSGDDPLAIDISNPSDPRILNQNQRNDRLSYDIEILGTYAYTTCYRDGLWTFDVSNPQNVVQLGVSPGDYTSLYRLCGREDYLVAIESRREWRGMYLFDCSDPARPVRVWGVLSEGTPSQIINASDGRVVFSAEGEAGVRCFRVLDDFRLWERGYYDTPGEAVALAIDGNRLFVGDGTFIQVLDVSDAYNSVFEDPIPVDFSISDPYPNPFNSTTSIQVLLPTSQHVELNMVDINGKIVQTTNYGRLSAGSHSITVDAGNLASGVYFAQINIGTRKYTQRAVLMR